MLLHYVWIQFQVYSPMVYWYLKFVTSMENNISMRRSSTIWYCTANFDLIEIIHGSFLGGLV